MKYNKEFFNELIENLENRLSNDFEIEDSYQESNFKVVINKTKVNDSEIFGFEINLNNGFLLDIIVIDSNGEIVDFVNQKYSSKEELMTTIFNILRKHIENFQ